MKLRRQKTFSDHVKQENQGIVITHLNNQGISKIAIASLLSMMLKYPIACTKAMLDIRIISVFFIFKSFLDTFSCPVLLLHYFCMYIHWRRENKKEEKSR